MLENWNVRRKAILGTIIFLILLAISGILINSAGGSREGPGLGIGNTDFIIGLSYVVGISIIAFITMAKKKFDNRLRMGFLILTFLVFFFIKGGHLITLIPKLLGSEGVRAAAGEVGLSHFEKHSFTLSVAGTVLTLGLTFILGRALCAYGCPVGSIQEIIFSIREKKKKISKLLPVKLAYLVRLLILFLIIIIYLVFSQDLVQFISPYQIWRLELILPGFLILIGFLVLSVFVYRPFCRIFCPFGAVAAIVAKFAIFRPSRGDSCTDCGLCDESCPLDECEKYGECYLCGRCFQSCNMDALNIE